MISTIEQLLRRIERDPVFRHRLETQPHIVFRELKLSKDDLALLDAILDEAAAHEAEVRGHDIHAPATTAVREEAAALRHISEEQRRHLQAVLKEMRAE